MKENYLYPHEMFAVNINGQYCGVFVPTKVMKKLMAISTKWSKEVQQCLNEYKDELLVQKWTLANTYNEDGTINKQQIVHYSDPNDQWDTVERRISMFISEQPKHTDVYLCGRETAQEIAMEILQESEAHHD